MKFSTIPLLLWLAATAATAQTTLIHYRVNAGDDISTSVPNLGTLGAGTHSGTGSVGTSDDVPSLGVPPTAGNRSLTFSGSVGLIAPGTKQLLNSEILVNGGFTFEAWIKYNGGSGVNSIIDYAGTEKLRRLASGNDVSMLTNADVSNPVIIRTAFPGIWHYVAAVFDNVTSTDNGVTITGDYTFYYDDTFFPATESVNVTITGFGDGLNRSIGVGMHPEGVAGDFFNGLIYEPRVTLGAVHPAQLLFTEAITVVTTLDDEDDGAGALGDPADISLREAINHSHATLIAFASSLDGGTLKLTQGELMVDQSVTIDASNLSGGITIDANGTNTAHRVMRISSGHSVALHGLTLTGGDATSGGFPGNAGGAIYSDGSFASTRLSLTGCTVFGNSAQFGGGIFSNGNSGGDARLTLRNCTIADNRATVGGGGGLFGSAQANGKSVMVLDHCTVAANSSAQAGGGLFNDDGVNGGTADLVLANAIVVSNTAATGPDIAESGNVTTSLNGENLVTSTDGWSGTGPTVTLTTDPKLSSLGYFGGPAQTMHPLAGSPAIRSGSTTRTDQRGFTLTGPPTIGAVKLGPVILVTNVADNLANTTLRKAIADATSPAVVIRFFDGVFDGHPANTIFLAGTELAINKSLFIDASDITGGVTIDGNSNGDFDKTGTETRCFLVSNGNSDNHLNVAFHNLTVQNGVHEGAFAGANIHNDNGENLTLQHCRILHGRALGDTQGDGRGGGIYNGGNLGLVHSTVSGNQIQASFAQGGGIYNFGNLTLSRSTISGNQTQGPATQGGGIRTGASSSEQTTLTHCTIANNTANAGGGIFNSSGLTIIDHCTIVANTATGGGGAGVSTISSSANETQISHSIVRDNGDGFDLAITNGIINSYEFPGAGNNLIGSVSQEVTGFIANHAPLNLAPLGDYGGSTQTMPPLPASPAIDAATPSTVTTDQRGFTITDGFRDIGATEFLGTADTTLFPLIWDTDSDEDGNTFGVEFALGTDPFVSDSNHPNNLTIVLLPNGDPAFHFGANRDAVGFATWILDVSPDLQNWTEGFSESALDPLQEVFELTDGGGSVSHRFYRFRAERLP